jgi:hypothetical protein
VQDVILAPVECLLVGIDRIAFVERFFLGIAVDAHRCADGPSHDVAGSEILARPVQIDVARRPVDFGIELDGSRPRCATMGFDDRSADGEAHTEPFSFCREERPEHASQFGRFDVARGIVN